MRCPKCSSTETKVLETRAGKGSASIRRRRQCSRCEHRFSTVEEILRDDAVVVKRDGRRESFDRGKLIGGIRKASEKRPLEFEQIELLVSEVMKRLENEYDVEFPSRAIAEAILARLKRIDEIAWLRFASFYQEYRDADDFTRVINELEQGNRE
ncbi:MAG: transcriptional regulator NrdR [Opitutales bacterium]